jgi:hypothetical protein
VATRQRFDPRRDYVVARPRKVLGTALEVGQPVDRELISDRRLRQMYEQGHVTLAPLGDGDPGGSEAGDGRTQPPSPVDPRDAVEIPADWEDLSCQRKRALASELLGEPCEDTDQAKLVIASELDRRHGPA